MAKHSISEAARLTGKARSTLHKHIKENRLSKEIDLNGKPCIDTAELIRLYGELQDTSYSATVRKRQQTTPQKYSSNNTLFDEVEALRQEKIQNLEKRISELEIERENLRSRLDASEEERRRLTERLLPAPNKPSEGLFKKLGQLFSGG